MTTARAEGVPLSGKNVGTNSSTCPSLCPPGSLLLPHSSLVRKEHEEAAQKADLASVLRLLLLLL